MNRSKIIFAVGILSFCMQTTQPKILRRLIPWYLAYSIGGLLKEWHLFKDPAQFQKQLTAKNAYAQDREELKKSLLTSSSEEVNKICSKIESSSYFYDLPSYLRAEQSFLRTMFLFKNELKKNYFVKLLWQTTTEIKNELEEQVSNQIKEISDK